MKRRKFIQQAGLTGLGLGVLPTILPARSVFASSRAPRVKHVVVVLFAGGIRYQESLGKQYLAAQGGGTGNVMPSMFNGALPSSNLIFSPWDPAINGNSLQDFGTLFTDVQYGSGPTGHYNGYSTALTGNYTTNDLNLTQHPEYPTLFEYYRKHAADNPDAANCWWISQNLGPYTLLNYSQHPDYGSVFGANHLRPLTLFDELGQKYFTEINSFHPEEQSRIFGVKGFLDNRFGNAIEGNVGGIQNTIENRERIKQYISGIYSGLAELPLALPPGMGTNELTGDLISISMGWSIMQEFAPELMVLSTFDSDVCHNDFSGSIQNMHKADYGVGWLWNQIQSDPEYADNTVMICMPEFGRNEEPNTIYDANGLRAFDHTNDANSRNTFALVVGPPGVVSQGQVVNQQKQVVDLVPTVAELLGFRNQIPSGLLGGTEWGEALV